MRKLYKITTSSAVKYAGTSYIDGDLIYLDAHEKIVFEQVNSRAKLGEIKRDPNVVAKRKAKSTAKKDASKKKQAAAKAKAIAEKKAAKAKSDAEKDAQKGKE